MRVSTTTSSAQTALAGALDGSRAATKIKEATKSLSTVKELGSNYAKLSQAADKLASPTGFKDEAGYTAALKDFATAYNATRTSAKEAGGIEGRQVQQATDRVSNALVKGAAASGFSVAKDGTLSVNEDGAKAAYKASSTKATATFAGGVADKLSQAKGAIATTVTSRSRKLEGEIEEATRQQVMLNKVTSRLASTYGARGELNQLSGPQAIYQLF